MDINEILEYLPHRYPFLLIDRVLEFEPGKRIVALKNVTINEPFFPGHFPHHPVMPGVLIIEAMAQAAAMLVVHAERPTSPTTTRSTTSSASTTRASRGRWCPATSSSSRSTLERALRGICKFGCVARVGGDDGRRGRRSCARCGRAGASGSDPSHRDRRTRARGSPRTSRSAPTRSSARRSRSARAPGSAPHVVITGHTRIGRDNRIFHFASLGGPPQDKKYAGEPTRLEIGDRNTIREYCTINRGTAQDARRHARRQRQLDHGLRAPRARLPDRQQHHVRQRTASSPATCTSATGRSSAASRWCTSSCTSARTPSPAWAPCVPQDVPPYVTAAGNHGAALRHQQRGPEAPRLHARGDRRR